MSSSSSSSLKPGSVAVVIGRMQPAHYGHLTLLRAALACAERVIVALGSAHQARSAKNPFTWQERTRLVKALVGPQDAERIIGVGVSDTHDDVRWVEQVTRLVNEAAPQASSVSLVGHFKDASSYYLRRFPHWALVEVKREVDLDATTLRRVLFETDDFELAAPALTDLAPPAVLTQLCAYSKFPWFERMKAEHVAVRQSLKQYGEGPHVTVDAIVRASDHVLLVQRGKAVGYGLWAIPGGYLEPDEHLLAGALRELNEETKLRLLPSSWDMALKEVRVFAHPQRSLRGRVVTHAHFFDLGHPRELPEVRGSDDAMHAEWVPISKLPSMREQLFEDHYLILEHFLLRDR